MATAMIVHEHTAVALMEILHEPEAVVIRMAVHEDAAEAVVVVVHEHAAVRQWLKRNSHFFPPPRKLPVFLKETPGWEFLFAWEFLGWEFLCAGTSTSSVYVHLKTKLRNTSPFFFLFLLM